VPAARYRPMGRPGSALDNAVIESWHSTLEFKFRSLHQFATRDQARTAAVAWIEVYNHLGIGKRQATRLPRHKAGAGRPARAGHDHPNRSLHG
jgi:hypothetical protein